MENAEKAVNYFAQRYNCSQSVLLAFAEELGLEKESALKISSGFGGGIARMQVSCGAVTGGVMVLGLRQGNTRPEDTETKEKNYELIRLFAERFRKELGSLNCRELLGFDLNTEEGRQSIKDNNLTEKVCRQCVRCAAQLLEEML